HVFESPFREHFTTDYVPSDAEIELIRAHLAPHEAELGRRDPHRTSLIHDLTVQRDRVKAHIDSHRALVSQPHRLPEDVIEKLFLACLPTRHNAVMSVAEPVVNLLMAFFSRRYALHISNIPPEDFALMAVLDAPLLTDIHITSKYQYDRDGFHILASNFLHGNSQEVTITLLDLRSLVPTTPFTWDHLTDLALQHNEAESFGEVGFLDFEAVHQLLKGCTHLRSLELPIRLSDQHANQPLLLPFLESLVIFNDVPSLEVSRYLLQVDLLVMPLLGRFHLFNLLQLATDEDRPVFTIEFLERFAARSSVIFDLYLDLLRLVLWTTNNLWTSSQLDTPELLGILTLDSKGSSPRPGLKDLILEADAFADDIWVNFLQMHLDHRTSLRKFNLHCWRDLPKIMPNVERFLAGGLAVSLGYTALGIER
ncbi:hypothetical protein K438DRAFT_1814570, partial [Mycena galopus ATCC 62051]